MRMNAMTPWYVSARVTCAELGVVSCVILGNMNTYLSLYILPVGLEVSLTNFLMYSFARPYGEVCRDTGFKNIVANVSSCVLLGKAEVLEDIGFALGTNNLQRM
jgi:hypothetical protein